MNEIEFKNLGLSRERRAAGVGLLVQAVQVVAVGGDEVAVTQIRGYGGLAGHLSHLSLVAVEQQHLDGYWQAPPLACMNACYAQARGDHS